MPRSKIISFAAGFLMLLPLASIAQTADQGELIRQLTQQAAKLQAQLDQLRQTTPPSSKNEDTTAPNTFDRDLYLGLRNDPDVSNLQEFLTDQGFYNQTISGNFFILTRNAVKKFQQAHGIRPSGYFGAVTRAAANGILTKTDIPPVHSANGSLVIDPASAALKVGEVIRVRAYYQPPMPPCPLGMGCIQVMPPQQEVLASFASDNPNIAVVEEIEDKSCAPPRMCPVAIRHSVVRGVSAGSATITASLYTDAAGTFTATMKVVVGGNADRARGSLSLDPPSAMLAVGETVKVKAIFTPPRPACLDAVPACEMPEQAPYEIDVALVSSDKSIALTTCPPESGRLTCIGSNGVRGVSPGKATVTGTYSTARDTFVAAMHVVITAAATTTITTL